MGIFGMDPDPVKTVGDNLVGTVSEEQKSYHEFALDTFHSNLTRAIMDRLPSRIAPHIKPFSENFYKYYGDVLNQRLNIGKALQGASDKTVANEVHTTDAFSVPPEAF